MLICCTDVLFASSCFRTVLSRGSLLPPACVSDDLSFLHFGTSGEFLSHLGPSYSGLMPRCHLSSVAPPTACHVAASATLVSSEISAGCSVGYGSVVCDSRILNKTNIASRCIVVGFDSTVEGSDKASEQGADAPPPPSFVLPPSTCLWQVPLKGEGEEKGGGKGAREVLLCCGVDDNPKDSVNKGGTFLGRPWLSWMRERGVQAVDLWPDVSLKGESSCAALDVEVR